MAPEFDSYPARSEVLFCSSFNFLAQAPFAVLWRSLRGRCSRPDGNVLTAGACGGLGGSFGFLRICGGALLFLKGVEDVGVLGLAQSALVCVWIVSGEPGFEESSHRFLDRFVMLVLRGRVGFKPLKCLGGIALR